MSKRFEQATETAMRYVKNAGESETVDGTIFNVGVAVVTMLGGIMKQLDDMIDDLAEVKALLKNRV
jgi:hypothetical protein